MLPFTSCLPFLPFSFPNHFIFSFFLGNFFFAHTVFPCYLFLVIYLFFSSPPLFFFYSLLVLSLLLLFTNCLPFLFHSPSLFISNLIPSTYFFSVFTFDAPNSLSHFLRLFYHIFPFASEKFHSSGLYLLHNTQFSQYLFFLSSHLFVLLLTTKTPRRIIIKYAMTVTRKAKDRVPEGEREKVNYRRQGAGGDN